jgi:hypothetical protein
MDLDSHPDAQSVRRHLVEHLGTPAQILELRGGPLPSSPVQTLQLALFAPNGPEGPVVFATCGACLFTMNDGRRIEAVIILRGVPKQESLEPLHRLLASFAVFAEANDVAIAVGDVVHAADELGAISAMGSLIFLPPLPLIEDFARIPLSDGGEVELMWILPLYATEAQYAIKHGPQALMLLLSGLDLDPLDLDRDEANVIISPDDARVLAEERAEEARKQAAKAHAELAVDAFNKNPVEAKALNDVVNVMRRIPGPAKLEQPARGERPAEAQPPRPDRAPQRERDSTVSRAPPPRRKPVIAKPVKAERVIRFDLATGKEITNEPMKRRPIAPAASYNPPLKPPKEPAPAPPSAEELREAKKKRVDELKRQAQEVVRRQAERAAAGDLPKPPEAPAPVAPEITPFVARPSEKLTKPPARSSSSKKPK